MDNTCCPLCGDPRWFETELADSAVCGACGYASVVHVSHYRPPGGPTHTVASFDPIARDQLKVDIDTFDVDRALAQLEQRLQTLLNDVRWKRAAERARREKDK